MNEEVATDTAFYEAMRTSWIIFVIVITLLGGCHDRTDSYPRSLVQLLADPGRYDGYYITTGGFFLYDPVKKVGHLYLDKDDAEYGIDYNSIQVLPDGIDPAYLPIEDFQARFVIIEGQFRKSYPNGLIREMARIVAFEPLGLSDCRYRPRPKGQTDLCGRPMVDRGYKGPR